MGNIKDVKAYRIVEEKDLPEVHGKGYVLEHIKTKARVLIIENDDVNKVFNIGFRTPPYDDSGIPHIIEHSVLCGSKKYPVKDPFVELAKGSLNTFLNAMTYSDKTVYPIASFNQKGFENIVLMMPEGNLVATMPLCNIEQGFPPRPRTKETRRFAGIGRSVEARLMHEKGKAVLICPAFQVVNIRTIRDI